MSHHGIITELRDWLSKQIIGQERLIDRLLIALLADGHLLVEGAPGLAKTKAIKDLSKAVEGDFHRIQFTPDLLPSDITGTEVFRPEDGSFRFQKGPIFHNLVLADEINRAPAKVQSALLEAMAEHQVSVGRESFTLPPLFLVMATQNPIEQEGTYPLPEAQLDRFMFNIRVNYPTAPEEEAIIKRVTGTYRANITKQLDGEAVARLQKVVRRVPVADHVVAYASQITRASRPREDEAPDFVREMVSWGAGPRAGIYLILAAKARAILQGRFHATTADVRAVALPVLRHRVLTTFNAEAAGVTSDDIVERLVEQFQPKADLEV